MFLQVSLTREELELLPPNSMPRFSEEDIKAHLAGIEERKKLIEEALSHQADIVADETTSSAGRKRKQGVTSADSTSKSKRLRSAGDHVDKAEPSNAQVEIADN
jgi:phage terminase large subunit-like protein